MTSSRVPRVGNDPRGPLGLSLQGIPRSLRGIQKKHVILGLRVSLAWGNDHH